MGLTQKTYNIIDNKRHVILLDRVGHYSYKVKYIPGKEIEFANALLRNPGNSVELPDISGGINFQG